MVSLEYSLMMPSTLRNRPPVTRAALMLVFGAIFATACSRTDVELQSAVDAELAIDAVTGTLVLDVSVTEGIVSISGAVESLEQQRHAVAIARNVDGVKDVIDQMYVNDTVLADAVKKALAADPLVGRIPLTVNARRGTVELVSDQTTKEDRIRAVDVASKVGGVKRVEDLMR